MSRRRQVKIVGADDLAHGGTHRLNMSEIISTSVSAAAIFSAEDG